MLKFEEYCKNRMDEGINVDIQAEAGFLSSITGNPQDDTNSLVYSDWLRDHNKIILADIVNYPRP